MSGTDSIITSNLLPTCEHAYYTGGKRYVTAVAPTTRNELSYGSTYSLTFNIPKQGGIKAPLYPTIVADYEYDASQVDDLTDTLNAITPTISSGTVATNLFSNSKNQKDEGAKLWFKQWERDD